MESNMRLKYRGWVRFYQIQLFSPLYCPDNKLRLRSKNFPDKRQKNEDNNGASWKDRMHLDVPDKGIRGKYYKYP